MDRLVSKVVSNAIDVNNLKVAFADLVAVDDVSLHVAYGEVAALEAEAARWREVAGELAGALNTAHNGLKWYRAECPQFVNGSDYEADEIIDAARQALQELRNAR